MRSLLFVLSLLLALPAIAEPVEPGAIAVVDGDTLQLHGRSVRLVGFDAPETWKARCESEHALGNRATARMRELVAGGGLDLNLIPCACRPGTQGTPICNYGRACGVLQVRGKDAAAIMIGEGLARSYVCGRSRCPPRRGWCAPAA